MLTVIRGAGDLATGVALRLWRAHIRVVMTDIPAPTAIRRTVCFSQAIVHGETTVEVLSPETIAGVRAVITGEELSLEYEDLCLGAGTLSSQEVSPLACLPRLMSALRDGWLLEENTEDWNGTPCLRLTVDQSGPQDGKILSTVWLRTEDGTPVRGEIAVEDEIILTADFTEFLFYDTMDADDQAGQEASPAV